MTRFETNVAETAETLNVTPRQALLLEFAAMAAWACIGRNAMAEATAYIGAAHARGDLSASDMRQCLEALDRKEAA